MQDQETKIVDNTRLETKCEIHIENIRRDKLRVTLWGDTAKHFNVKALQQLVPPIFVVFTSLKVKEFQGQTVLNSTISTLFFINPDIPELQSYKTFFSHFTYPIRVMPPSAMPQLAPEQLANSKRLSVTELNVLDPDIYKNTFVICRAAITRFDTRGGWWYQACASCFKQLRVVPHNDRLVCPKHTIKDQPPFPWFKVGLILEDANDEANVMIIGKVAEQLFGISCYQLVVEKGYTNQEDFPYAILQVRGQYKLFQLRFGAIKNDLNRSDLLIQAVFDNIQPLLESDSSLSDQPLLQYEKKDTTGQIFPSTPPSFPKETSATPLSASSTSSPNEPMSTSKEKAKLTVKKRLFTSLIKTQKKFKSDLKKDVADSDDALLISLKTKIASSNVGIVISPPKKDIKISVEEQEYQSTLQQSQQQLDPLKIDIKKEKSPSTT